MRKEIKLLNFQKSNTSQNIVYLQVCANGHKVRPMQAGYKQTSTDKAGEKAKGMEVV